MANFFFLIYQLFIHWSLVSALWPTFFSIYQLIIHFHSNFIKVNIKYQSHLKYAKIDAFERKICTCHSSSNEYLIHTSGFFSLKLLSSLISISYKVLIIVSLSKQFFLKKDLIKNINHKILSKTYVFKCLLHFAHWNRSANFDLTVKLITRNAQK